ncbi:type IV pilin protein [Candidatus Vondammii sp. HM_W22]|uniref:type IV pilin protein n=1 Tax=Candidatus Vondammii sp. HM_W22 TaxID=2687299 RepID=UPI002402BA4C|nr:type IV pilin protein [Candidatus Vondammii sp. HM_W22]
MRKSNIKRVRGFTLIELMITVAVIGVLAAIAYPSYRDQIIKTQRTDGKSALIQAAVLQERWFTENSKYTTDMTKLGGSNSQEGHYVIGAKIGDITGTACNKSAHTKDNCFELTATPGSTQSDNGCKNLTLDSFGRKKRSGTDNRCW